MLELLKWHDLELCLLFSFSNWKNNIFLVEASFHFISIESYPVLRIRLKKILNTFIVFSHLHLVRLVNYLSVKEITKKFSEKQIFLSGVILESLGNINAEMKLGKWQIIMSISYYRWFKGVVSDIASQDCPQWPRRPTGARAFMVLWLEDCWGLYFVSVDFHTNPVRETPFQPVFRRKLKLPVSDRSQRKRWIRPPGQRVRAHLWCCTRCLSVEITPVVFVGGDFEVRGFV